MKKMVYITLIMCLLLSACGKGTAEPVSTPAPVTESPAPTPSPEVQLVRLTPEEREQKNLEEGNKWLEEEHTHWGKFYAHNEDYEYFMSLPQDEPAVFTVRYFFKMGEAGEKMNELESQIIPRYEEMEEIEAAAREGLQIQGYTYGADTSAWEYDNPNVKSALPLEYFQLRDQAGEIARQITDELQERRDEERNQLTLELAQLLAEKGCKTEVWAVKKVENYKEKLFYTCFLTATPEELWALEALTDISTVFVEPQHESVRLRFDIPIWSSEETAS